MFISTIKENYLFLLLLVFLTMLISIQGCQPSQPTLSLGNCCKIKNPLNVTQACIATSLDDNQCSAIAAQTGSSYELVPASSCLNLVVNPDCGIDEFNNKIGCYINDGSGVNRFIPQANPPEDPQPESKYCKYSSTELNYCNQGEWALIQDCASQNCVNGVCQSCTPICSAGQSISSCNTLCCGPGNKLTMHLDNQYDDDFAGEFIDDTKWNVDRGNNVFEITQGGSSDNRLRLYKGATPIGNYSGNINSLNKFELTGNFIVEIGFDLIYFPYPEVDRGNQLILAIKDSVTGNAWYISRQKWSQTNGYNCWGTNTQTFCSKDIKNPGLNELGDTIGKMRLERKDGMMYGYIYNSTNKKWINIGSTAQGVNNNPVYVAINLQNYNNGDTLDVKVDHFVVYKPIDSSGNNNHGAVYGNVKKIQDRFGNFYDAFELDGKTGYVEVPSSTTLDIKPFTAELWVKLNAQPTSNPVQYPSFISRIGTLKGWQILYDSSGNINIVFRPNSLPEQYHVVNHPLLNDNQYHLVATYSDNGVSATTKLYVNGQLIGTKTHTNKIMVIPTGEKLYIGTNRDGAPSGYTDGRREVNGIIDEVNVYNRVLTSTEILNRYNNQFKCTDY